MYKIIISGTEAQSKNANNKADSAIKMTIIFATCPLKFDILKRFIGIFEIISHDTKGMEMMMK